MTKLNSKSKIGMWLGLLALFAVLGTTLALAQKRPAATEPPSVAWKAPPEGKPGDYVGREVCAGCHPSEDKQFAKTVHAEVGPAGATYGTGCEACHGPGKAHADAMAEGMGNEAKTAAAKKLIFSFNANPKENAERCLACHITGKVQDFFGHSPHLAAGVSCNQCHSAHLLKAAENPNKVELATAQSEFFQVPGLPEENRWLNNNLLKKSQPALCYTCHRTVQAQFALPEHHRVPEGFMKCTDCHNPHGNLNHFQLTKANWETCVKCHVEKRGPFLFEHAAVRTLGCVACHTPHGSVNNFLVKRREIRLLCLQCHSVIHTSPEITGLHGQANVPHGRGGYQASGPCTRCHVAVHGSNFDEYFLR
jgi:predicted CXXCH cytochrome family protein